mmetsp:Transcript_9794/g.14712  ORF Transcript_9794/g.14712 Transcript_9794/m.14712 type:complete len:160 (-) Transcript_9794:160-639(-)
MLTKSRLILTISGILLNVFIESKGNEALISDEMQIIGKSRLFPCQLCNRTYTTVANVRRHLRVHKDEKLYPCSYCKSSFHNRFEVTRHERLHTGNRPFPCKRCNKTFKQRCHLRNHEHRCHMKTQCAETTIRDMKEDIRNVRIVSVKPRKVIRMKNVEQ